MSENYCTYCETNLRIKSLGLPEVYPRFLACLICGELMMQDAADETVRTVTDAEFDKAIKTVPLKFRPLLLSARIRR